MSIEQCFSCIHGDQIFVLFSSDDFNLIKQVYKSSNIWEKKIVETQMNKLKNNY
jgi:hypothetical protein